MSKYLNKCAYNLPENLFDVYQCYPLFLFLFSSYPSYCTFSFHMACFSKFPHACLNGLKNVKMVFYLFPYIGQHWVHTQKMHRHPLYMVLYSSSINKGIYIHSKKKSVKGSLTGIVLEEFHLAERRIFYLVFEGLHNFLAFLDMIIL